MADLFPQSFLYKGLDIIHKYVLIPDVDTFGDIERRKPYPDIPTWEWDDFVKSHKNTSEWLAVDKHLIGDGCYQIGVSYSSFRTYNYEEHCRRGTYNR